MKVTLIAATLFYGSNAKMATQGGWSLPEPWDPTGPPLSADYLAEFAGRACYQSWNRPNPKTSSNAGYLDHILEVGHESVLEHGSATFYITGVSRSLTHELVRHRHLSFSQLSQRFVDESNVDFVYPPALTTGDQWELDHASGALRAAYKAVVTQLLLEGLSRKQAREAARCVLPNMTETRIVVTGNHRAWREVIAKRNSPAADAEIQLLAKELLLQLKGIAPNTYQDMNPDGSQ